MVSIDHAYAAYKVWIWWVVPFFQKQGIITKKKKKVSPKTDDVIVMSSNVHEWKGKPWSILMQQIIRNKVTPNNG